MSFPLICCSKKSPNDIISENFGNKKFDEDEVFALKIYYISSEITQILHLPTRPKPSSVADLCYQTLSCWNFVSIITGGSRFGQSPS